MSDQTNDDTKAAATQPAEDHPDNAPLTQEELGLARSLAGSNTEIAQILESLESIDGKIKPSDDQSRQKVLEAMKTNPKLKELVVRFYNRGLRKALSLHHASVPQ